MAATSQVSGHLLTTTLGDVLCSASADDLVGRDRHQIAGLPAFVLPFTVYRVFLIVQLVCLQPRKLLTDARFDQREA